MIRNFILKVLPKSGKLNINKESIKEV